MTEKPRGVLVVDPYLDQGYCVAIHLAGMGLTVTVSRTFVEAKSLLGSNDYALLITALRLHDYNGLHLVARARSVGSDLRAVVTELVRDPVLEAEAERLGATYLVVPAPIPEILAAVSRTLARPADRLSPPIRPPYERRTMDRRGPRSLESSGDERRRAERRRDLVDIFRADLRLDATS